VAPIPAARRTRPAPPPAACVTRFEEVARRLAGLLDTLDVGYALVGGFAVSARSEPRFTRDLDFAVAVADDEVAEGVVRALLDDQYRILAMVVGEISSPRCARSPGALDAGVRPAGRVG
jgi:hypothetical protein